MVNANEPIATHRVTHYRGWHADLRFDATMQIALQSEDSAELEAARQNVAVDFALYCIKNVVGFDRRQVFWKDLEVRPLTMHEQALLLTARDQAVAAAAHA